LFSSSVLGVNLPTYGAYIASKAGVEGLVRVLANEMRGRKVTVNAVVPGPVATELFLTGKTPATDDHTIRNGHHDHFVKARHIALTDKSSQQSYRWFSSCSAD
jgi:NAD(P)-dependent dehydrogenase (short-subunit alcohol dehydrogenase family)